MVNLTVNGSKVSVNAPDDMPLLWVLRDILGMTGTKFGCGIAQCGACTVHVDGEPTRSCITPVGRSPAGRSRRSRRSARRRRDGRYRRLGSTSKSSSAAIANRARSCRRRAASRRYPSPTDEDIDDGMSGNICRCGTYVRIRAAIKQRGEAGERDREAVT